MAFVLKKEITTQGKSKAFTNSDVGITLTLKPISNPVFQKVYNLLLQRKDSEKDITFDTISEVSEDSLTFDEAMSLGKTLAHTFGIKKFQDNKTSVKHGSSFRKKKKEKKKRNSAPPVTHLYLSPQSKQQQ